jgi:hypothetical protein
MPLVRIDLRKGKDATYRQKIGGVVYDALLSVGVPNNDRFQVIGEHEAENFLFDPDYLGIHRSQDLVIIQVTWNEGRSVDQKKALYKAIADPSRRCRAPAGRHLHKPHRGKEGKLVLWQRRSTVRDLKGRACPMITGLRRQAPQTNRRKLPSRGIPPHALHPDRSPLFSVASPFSNQ